jgi:hypothetical protein
MSLTKKDMFGQNMKKCKWDFFIKEIHFSSKI